MKYILLINGNYINSFESYNDAIEVKNIYLMVFPRIDYEIKVIKED